MRRAWLALPLLLATGCGEVLTANVRSVETLARDDSSDHEQAWAIGILATTGVVGAIVVGFLLDDAGSGAPPAPIAPVAPPTTRVEHGWGLVRAGGRVTWNACTTPYHCRYETRTASEADVLEVEDVGHTYPVRPDTTSGAEVVVQAIRVRVRPSEPPARWSVPPP